MATLICNQIDNDSSMVIVTEFVGEAHVAMRGQWGVDEPGPAGVPDLVENRRYLSDHLGVSLILETAHA